MWRFLLGLFIPLPSLPLFEVLESAALPMQGFQAI
jgi:hypothetical protein